jgi:hypothetical protein
MQLIADLTTSLTAISTIITSLALLVAALGTFLVAMRKFIGPRLDAIDKKVGKLEKGQIEIHEFLNSDKTAELKTLLVQLRLVRDLRRRNNIPVPSNDDQEIDNLEEQIRERLVQQQKKDDAVAAEHARSAPSPVDPTG